MELPRPRSIGILLAAALLLAIIVTWLVRPKKEPPPPLVIPGDSLTLTVEVLNGTRVDGLARTMTGRLRLAGIDVVYFGSARDSEVDSTLIIVRSGDSLSATPILEVLGAGRIVVEPDSLLLLDVTVLLGLDLAGTRGRSP